MEKLVRNHIVDHMVNNKLFSNRQYGFISGRSTTLQLLKVLDSWTVALDAGLNIDVIYMDFMKAFDTVPHELLKSKMNHYGVSSQVVNWIDSFLCYRTQCVVVNGSKSSSSQVLSGVPQGTVLGPLLFSIYINDIIKVVDSEIRLFADDCVCYRTIYSENDTLALQKDIDNLGKWARTWGMRFQPVKCNIMCLTKNIKNKISNQIFRRHYY